MKRALSIFLSAVMMLSCVAVTISASAGDTKKETHDGIIYYYTVKDKAATIVSSEIKTQKDSKTLNIPSKLGGYPVKTLEKNATSGVARETVVIPDSVITARESSVGNSKTKTIKIGKGLKTIKSSFANCTFLKSISVSSKNKYFLSEEGVLYNKGKTTLIAYPAEKAGTSYTVAKTTKTIDSKAFANQKKLKTLTISKNVKTIKSDAFISSNSLTKFVLDKSNKNFYVKEGVLYNKKKTILVAYPSAKSGEKYSVLKGVTKIAGYAFSGASKLCEVKLPSTVTEISNKAFQGAYKLKTAALPSKLKTIGNNAFEDTALTEVVAPKTLETLGSSAFQSCDKLKTVDLSKSKLKIINASSFYEDSKITSIKLPKTLETIKNNAFTPAAITTLDLPENVQSISKGAFSGCAKLKTVIVRGINTDISNGLPKKEYITYAEEDEDENNPITAYKYSFTIKAKKGSKAEQFALENSISFVEL